MSQKTLEQDPCLLPLTVYFHFIPDNSSHLHIHPKLYETYYGCGW